MEREEKAMMFLTLIMGAFFIGMAWWAIASANSQADPLETKCYKSGGTIAYYHHGKSTTYLCVNGDRVTMKW